MAIVLASASFCDKKSNHSPSPATPGSTTKNDNSATPGPATPNYTMTSTDLGSINLGTSSVTPNYTMSSTELGLVNLAVANSTLQVSTTMPEWTFNSCLLNSLTLTGTNGTSTVILTFGGVIITSGNYVTTSGVPLPGEVRITVINAPGQPTGILWYSKNGGSVSVSVGASTTVAAFTNIPCTQPLFAFPVVTVNGDVGCQ